MILAFTLTMPSVNTWNGRWSGEEKTFAIIKTLSNSAKNQELAQSLDGRSFQYAWPDGWCARISVQAIDSREAARLRRQSMGFMGYGWMVESIMQHGEIRTPEAES